MSKTKTVNYHRAIPDVMKALTQVHEVMGNYGFDSKLTHLILLRASQINRCGYCVKMHTKDARWEGETDDRLDRLVVWDQVKDFDEREKAALAWTEALTTLGAPADFASLRNHLHDHFTDEEIGILTATIGMINLWNRIRLSGH